LQEKGILKTGLDCIKGRIWGMLEKIRASYKKEETNHFAGLTLTGAMGLEYSRILIFD
jgi:plastocyanin domain-containing protein